MTQITHQPEGGHRVFHMESREVALVVTVAAVLLVAPIVKILRRRRDV